MAPAHAPATLVALILVSLILPICSGDPTITLNVINQCNHKVWAAILQNSGSPPIPTSGFSLKPGESKTLSVPTGTWSGRLWGRTRCNHDDAGKFSCVTGDCGTATVECSTGRFTPPVSVAEFFLNSAAGGLDWYDISFVDGFNLPMSVAPTDATSGGWSCSISGCDVDLNRLCPIELRMNHKGQTMACKSSCDARAVPTSCEPKSYSEYFKNLCPRARVYASDRTSLMSCSSLAYDVIFCPSSSSPANNSSSSPANSTGLNTTNEYNSDEGGKVKPSTQFSIKYLMKKFQQHLAIAVPILLVLIIGLIFLIILCCRRNPQIFVAPDGHLHCCPITLCNIN